ncbi:MAG: DUF4389 domain-containing protein [Gammaproteobacteria bacterium]|nr:DUF4389 domain-containing protein [Gammaproteobacteria bacterium]
MNTEVSKPDQPGGSDAEEGGNDEPSIWKRLLFMLLCAVLYSVAEVVLFALVVLQFFFKLITGGTNERLLLFGQSIATYIYQIVQYLNFNCEYMPFPFNDWPRGAPLDCEEEA